MVNIDQNWPRFADAHGFSESGICRKCHQKEISQLYIDANNRRLCNVCYVKVR